MLTRRQLLLGLLSLSIAPPAFAASSAFAATSASAANGPDTLVAGLYQRVLKNHDAPAFGVAKSDQRLLSHSLSALWAKTQAARKKSGDTMGPLDFDVVTNSQTGDLKSYTVTVTASDARSATVMARFNRGNQYPKAERNDAVEYRLVNESGWSIDDIRGKTDGTPWSLRALLTDYLKS